MMNSNAWVPEMTLFLFWWTNKYTCTPEETVCHCLVAYCVTVQFVLPNPTGTGKNGINHYCYLPYTRNQRQCHRKWTPIGQLVSKWKSCLLFCQIFRRNLLRTRNIVTPILSRRFLCQGQMSAQPGVGSSQHVKLVKPYFSVNYNMVRWISAPSTIHFRPRCEIFVLVVCLQCFNFVNIPPPSKINMELRWVNNVNLFSMFSQFNHHTEIDDSF